MVLYESEDDTIQKLNTYTFDSRPSVTIMLDEVCDNVDTRNVEKNNLPPPYESVHLSSLTNYTPNECIEQSAVVKNNQMHYLLYHLSKNIILILLYFYSVVNRNCDRSDFLHFKYDIFKKYERTVVDVIFPNLKDPIFMQKILNDTKNLAKNSKYAISIIEIKTLLYEMINFHIEKIAEENNQREENNPLLAERLQCVSEFFTKTQISPNSRKRSGKRKNKDDNDTKNIATKRNKRMSEEHVSSTSNESLIDEIFSYTQTHSESISDNYGNKTIPEPSKRKAISPVLLTMNNNLQTQLGPGDISPKQTTGPCPPLPIITYVTSLNPTISLAADGNCRMCNAITKKMCNGCLRYYYCSSECQVLEWPQHQYECNKSTLY